MPKGLERERLHECEYRYGYHTGPCRVEIALGDNSSWVGFECGSQLVQFSWMRNV